MPQPTDSHRPPTSACILSTCLEEAPNQCLSHLARPNESNPLGNGLQRLLPAAASAAAASSSQSASSTSAAAAAASAASAIAAAAITPAELDSLSGVTSNIQEQLDSLSGVTSGIQAQLDAVAKVTRGPKPYFTGQN